MPTRIGRHDLYVKELKPGHYVAYLETHAGIVIASRWLDHKPTASELSRLAQEMSDEAMSTNPQEREKRKRVGDTVYTVEQTTHGMWILKANGVALGYPSSYQHACEGFAALTGTTHKNPPGNERLIRGVGVGRGTLVTETVWKKIDGSRIKEFPSYSTVGGYPLYYLVGEPGTKKGQYNNVVTVCAKTINSGQLSEDDIVIDVDINYEDSNMYDELTGERIPSAYNED